MPNYIAGVGSICPKLMFVGEAPGKVEDELGYPWAGPAGELLDNILFAIGITLRKLKKKNFLMYFRTVLFDKPFDCQGLGSFPS